MNSTTIKARRITGGAIVTVSRADGRTHRHRVGLRRYSRLADILATVHGASGWTMRSGFVFALRSARGFADARGWLERYYIGTRRPKHWAPKP